MGKLDGKVALVTGVARGQGRSHARRLAAEGAAIIGVDVAGPVDTVGYPGATPDDLRETVDAVEAAGGRILAERLDVRDGAGLDAFVASAVKDLGRLDVVSANAGILGPPKLSWELSDDEWGATVDVNLTGVWKTTRAAVPHMIASGGGGSIVLTASVGGHRGAPHVANYVAAKHGVIGLMKSLANELGDHRIRVNAVCPTNVRTPMIDNDVTARLF
ncbi:MAG TPA: mycofactocin-coupled SDR family oxidoreductase, partial [Baekduia sp.]